MAGAPVGAAPHTAYAPQVVGPSIGITQTRFYQSEVRIPQPNLPGASGRATDPAIHYSLASAGLIAQDNTDANVRRLVLIMPTDRPIER